MPRQLTFDILRQLSDGAFHSGEKLAAQFGISRASVHYALQDVADYGLVLHRVRGRGYRLARPVQWLDAVTIKQQLDTGTKITLEILDQATSTNTLLLERAARGAPSGTVLAAEWQSAGRGRLGRTWHAGLGEALTFSLLWRFARGPGALSGLSLAVSVAVVRALNALGVHGVMLKWPNDILLGEGKLAGILLETQGDMLGPAAVVIGIGLNLCLSDTARAAIDQPVSDLAMAGVPITMRNHVFGVVLAHLFRIQKEFAQHGFAPLREEWEAHHAFQQHEVELFMPDGTRISGRVCGVTETGALRVLTATGEQVLHAGEISLRSAQC